MSEKIKIAVLVSGGGTNLQALIDAEKSGIIKSGHIVRVISNKPGAYALERAAAAGIPSATVVSAGKDRREFEKELLECLDGARAQIVVLAGFMRVLSPEFVSHFPRRMINVHPSLIPSFCGDGFYGLRVHEAALAYGVKVTGATVHFVNEVTDGGEIIMQKAVEVKDGDTPEILQQRVMREAEHIILPLAVEKTAKAMANGLYGRRAAHGTPCAPAQ